MFVLLLGEHMDKFWIGNSMQSSGALYHLLIKWSDQYDQNEKLFKVLWDFINILYNFFKNRLEEQFNYFIPSI